MGTKRVIFHIDANNAFLSWTAVDLLKKGYKIDIRTVPSIIGGDEEARRGIVLAKSPVAKSLGIKTAEPIFFAKQKCPNLLIFKSDFKLYKKYSNMMIDIFRKNTDTIEQFSIDECFLDMTNSLFNNEDPIERAKQISTEIKETLGFTVNIGISENKLLAKMASDFEKPDKIHTLYKNEIEEKMWPLPISSLFGVGKQTAIKLERIGLKTIGDIAKSNSKLLENRFGKFGKEIWEHANGIDDSLVQKKYEKPKGIGNSITLPKDEDKIENLEKILLGLSEEVGYRLRKEKMLTNTVCVNIKTNTFVNFSHQKKLNFETSSTKEIYKAGKELLHELFNKVNNTKVRLIGLRVDTIPENSEKQISLFDKEEKHEEKQNNLDSAIDKIKGKYGYNIISRAGDMDVKEIISPRDEE